MRSCRSGCRLEAVLRRLIPPRSDVILAAGVAALAMLEISLNQAIEPRAAAISTELAAALALAWRRRLPLGITVLVGGFSLSLGHLLGVPVNQPIIPLLAISVAAYSIAAHAGLERAIVGWALMVVFGAVATKNAGLANFVFGAIWVSVSWATGQVVRLRTAAASELEKKTRRLERQREDQARLAADEERTRIAHELYDVISHSVSVMLVQAGAAEQVLRRNPERAIEPLGSIQETGRQAIADLGRLLGVLRANNEEVGIAPQPGVAEAGPRVDPMRLAGFPVELRFDGRELPPTPGTGLPVCRAVQDAIAHRLIPPRSDIAVAAGLVALTLFEVWLNPKIEPKAAAAATELVAATVIAWRRRLPLATAALVAVSLGLESVLGVPTSQPVIPLLTVIVAVYSVAAHSALDHAIVGGALVIVAAAVTTPNPGWIDVAFVAVLTTSVLAAGRLVRSRTARADKLGRDALRLERERQEQARLAAVNERARIARELHDVISHSVSVMVVQAGAAAVVLQHNPERALEALQSIQETGRQAIAELGRLLGVLRADAEEPGLTPQPGIADLPDLIAKTEAAGLSVELRMEGQQRPLTPGVELSLYRVVQEALTNTRKHAGPVPATVVLRYGDRDIVAEISDNGVAAIDSQGCGHGLVGMRERVALYNGSLEAGRRPGGGFLVRVRMPLEAR